MINPHREIYLFLQGRSETGLDIITNIFFKQLNSSSFVYLTNYYEKEDLFMDFMSKLFEKREYLLNLFENQENGLPSYIRLMASNFLKDRIKSLSDSREKAVFNNERLTYTEGRFEEVIIQIDAFKLSETLKKELKEDEILLLCYITAPDKKDFEEKYFSSVNKNALYKRVQRVKEKLRKVVVKHGFAQEVVGYYIEHLLPAKCKRGNADG
ncbi:sigma-70 family RNA polymerase sigma factor [Persephonella atlantica]|uniref:Sigma-70 family RNA polymerase sigma factor n=1 Tax=Persephonella atlantica TaxID=2699429 RepID=A0ABS1GI72_9AQUI|nr:sigma-70 family RNA polymerase sigma factor [Persephonella atlantica]MBK3332643.1 sigma-70 family RNA polymerase sigma factor [Persephonella atlantica]